MKLAIFSDTIFNLPMWIAEERGYFAEEGIDFGFETISMKQAHDAVLSGDLPFTMLGPEVAFLENAERPRVRIIAGNANRLPHSLIAQPRFKKVADLKGAKIGVISDIEGTTYVAQRMASAAGLKRSDYTIAAVGGAPARVKLMDDGAIDAALQPFPLSYQAEAKGFSNLGWAADVVPEWQFSVVMVNEQWLRAEPDTAMRMLRASIRGRRFMSENPAATAEITARRIKTTLPLAQRALDDTLKRGIIHADLRWSEPGLAEVYATLQQTGVILPERAFRMSDYVDDGPLTRALSA